MNRRILGTLGATALILAGSTLPALALERGGLRDGGRTVSVTVTNVTRGQVLSPPIVVVHEPAIALFRLGEPAGPELAAVAEDADAAPLLALLGTLPQVHDVNVAAGVIPPGGSRTVEVAVTGRADVISVVGMLVTTNDAFYAATIPAIPARFDRGGVAAEAYDAGSEANTESCAHIPGPPCGNGGVRVTEGAEGFVHVHAGIHGGGDLDPATHDWRNPVAYVTVD
jgi:hypothetical protein